MVKWEQNPIRVCLMKSWRLCEFSYFKRILSMCQFCNCMNPGLFHHVKMTFFVQSFFVFTTIHLKKTTTTDMDHSKVGWNSKKNFNRPCKYNDTVLGGRHKAWETRTLLKNLVISIRSAYYTLSREGYDVGK